MIILRNKEFSKKLDDEKKAKIANAASDALHLGAGVAIGSGIYKSGEAWGRARAMDRANNFNKAIKAGRSSNKALATGLALAATSAGAKIYANKKKKDSPKDKNFSEDDKPLKSTEKVLKTDVLASSVPVAIHGKKFLHELEYNGFEDAVSSSGKKLSKHAKLAGGLAIGAALVHDYNKNHKKKD